MRSVPPEELDTHTIPIKKKTLEEHLEGLKLKLDSGKLGLSGLLDETATEANHQTSKP